MNRSIWMSAVLLGSFGAADGFEWNKLVPPVQDFAPKQESSATGSAATRGIDEEDTVASGRGDFRAVDDVERAEPPERNVRLFVDKGGLAAGRAPGPKPPMPQGRSSMMEAGLNALRVFDSSGYGESAGQVAKGVVGLGEGEERELGRRVAAQVLAKHGYWRNGDVEHYANLVAAVIGRNSDRPELHYHVALLDTEAVNAFAAPGGYLFLTRGIVGLLRDESELAGVLAHEVAHVSGKHVLAAMREADLLGGALSAARRSGFSAAEYQQMSDFTLDVLSRGLSRSDELESDASGALFATRAGYGGQGLLRFLRKLEQRKRDADSRRMVLFRTHPPAADRIAELQSGLSSSDHRLADRFGRFVVLR